MGEMRANRRIGLLAAVIASAGCTEDTEPRSFDDHEEASDLEPYENEKFDGPLATFSADLVVSDTLFEADEAVTAAGIQDMLEMSPYRKRSFLADEKIRGVPFSQVVVNVARERGLNPLLLLARMQVEKSLISKTTRPSGNAVDFALGCGCHDGKKCDENFRGIDKQLACAAKTLRTHFDGSVAGTGAWKVGTAKKTLDPQTVTPRSHATASLYAYTPWVLEGMGGNWLVWNVTRKYVGAMLDRGTYNEMPAMPEPDPETMGSCAEHCGSMSAVPVGDGTSCFCDATCASNDDCCEDFVEQCG